MITSSLRWCAGGSYLDLLCFAWGISKSTFFSDFPEKGVVWPVIDAIDAAFTIGLPMNNIVALQRLADEFSILSHGELKGCVTAIDGWLHKRVSHIPAKQKILWPIEIVMAVGAW